jgi:hypothetical protein
MIPDFFPKIDANNQCTHCKHSVNPSKPEEVQQHIINCVKKMIGTPYISGGM